MDRYGARGELLAAQHETILGPFCVPAGVDQAIEFNRDGTTTIYEHGRTRTETTHHITDERYKLTRDQWAGIMAQSFYIGFYHDVPDAFFTELDTMRSDKCRGELSPEWSEWIEWAHKIIRQVKSDSEE